LHHLQLQFCEVANRQEMVDRKFFLSEGFCGLLLSRCGEAHHIQFAEDWVKHGETVGENPGLKTSARQRGGASHSYDSYE